MTASTEKERAEFEAWWREYGRGHIDVQWEAWQAARRAQSMPWVQVIDEAMVCAHIGVADISDDYATAKAKLNNLICWEIDVAKFHATQEPQEPPKKQETELPHWMQVIKAKHEEFAAKGLCGTCEGEGQAGGQFCGGMWECYDCNGTGKHEPKGKA